MTSLEDKAESEVDVTLAADLVESQYRLVSLELTPADELGTDDFPLYGDFAEVEERSPVDGTFRGQSHVEIPASLASWLVEAEVGTSDWWQVIDAEKVDGSWRFEVEVASRGDEVSLEDSEDRD